MHLFQDSRATGAKFIAAGLTAALVATLLPLCAYGQIHVAPQRPTQSNVQYFDFEWFHKDIEIGPEADTAGADAFGLNPFASRLEAGYPRLSFDNEEQPPDFDPQQRPRRHGVADYYSSAPPAQFTDIPEPGDEGPTSPPSPTFQDDEPEQQDDDADPVFEPTELDDKTGGVRLYFYERERDIAERAAAFIHTSYRELVDIFQFVPSRTLPYILYNSYQEFLQTNIFPVQEGVLGVTGRAQLELVLPYFGDHRLFEHISIHEMVHQFQIQKAREIAQEAGVNGDPMDRMPLWFIEGMAEYYALDGLDEETEMLTRDLLINPRPQEGFVMLDFFEDRPGSQLWTYKIGQARVAFLEEVYGKGTIQEVFNRSYRLIGSRDRDQPGQSFRSLLSEITGDSRREISDKFEAWIKRRSYTRYLDARQDSPDLQFFEDTRGVMQTMTTSPNGQLLMYRSIQRSTGQVQLFVTDAEQPRQQRRVARDGRPGVESLHPVGPRNFALDDDQLAYVARTEGHDKLYLQQIDHQFSDEGSRDARVRLGSSTGFDLGEHGLLAAESPAFSPDGNQVAFIGLDEDGQKDIFVFDPGGDEPSVTRVTDSPHAERGLSWGDDQLVFSSDATGHGHYNLFAIDMDDDQFEPRRLTAEERDHFDPRIMPDGQIFFSTFDNSRANLHRLDDDDQIIQLTDVVTGLFDVSPGANGKIRAAYQHRGQRRVVTINEDKLLDEQTDVEAEDPDEVEDYPTVSLDDAQRYRATDIGNWQLSNLFGVLGASAGGIFGQLMLLTNDRLRNHALFVNVLAFGDLENTVADVLYLNQSRRLIWGTGLFQDVRYRIDRPLQQQYADATGDTRRFLSGERFYGAQGTLRYPFNRFFFIQGGLRVGGVTFFLPGSTEAQLDDAEADLGEQFIAPWEDQHDEHRFQASPSMSLGYNTIRYHPRTGPIDGTSALLQNRLDLQPLDDEVHGSVRLDAERYFPIYDRMNISLRGGIGSTFGGELARQFFLSSFDTLRGVEFGDLNYLLGNQFLFTKLELRFPLDFLIRVPLIDIEGVVGADFGGAGESPADVWDSRAFSPVTGLNFGLGPLVFRLHFARPIDIGSVHPLPRGGDWITNFSLGWRYW